MTPKVLGNEQGLVDFASWFRTKMSQSSLPISAKIVLTFQIFSLSSALAPDSAIFRPYSSTKLAQQRTRNKLLSLGFDVLSSDLIKQMGERFYR